MLEVESMRFHFLLTTYQFTTLSQTAFIKLKDNLPVLSGGALAGSTVLIGGNRFLPLAPGSTVSVVKKPMFKTTATILPTQSCMKFHE